MQISILRLAFIYIFQHYYMGNAGSSRSTVKQIKNEHGDRNAGTLETELEKPDTHSTHTVLKSGEENIQQPDRVDSTVSCDITSLRLEKIQDGTIDKEESIDSKEILSDLQLTHICQIVKNGLQQLPVRNKDLIDIDELVCSSEFVVQEFEFNQDILIKGSDPQGIYFIIDGQVNVVTSDGEDILVNLYSGEFFGEISSIFGIPCTASVRTASNCRVAVIKPEICERFNPNKSVFDWFVHRKYLPTSSTSINLVELEQEIAATCIQQTTLTLGWTDLSMSCLVQQINPVVVIYPARSCIMMEDDPPTALHVIIRGRVQILDKNKDVIVTIDTNKHPFIVGEYTLHVQRKCNITVIAQSCCHVITIIEEWIENVLDKNPEDAGIAWEKCRQKWKTYEDKVEPFSPFYSTYLHPEVIFEMFKRCNILTNSDYIPEIILTGIPQVYQPGEDICRSNECDKTILLVVKGNIELITRKYGKFDILQGDIYGGCEKKIKLKKLVANSECLLWTMNLHRIQHVLMELPDVELSSDKWIIKTK